METADTILIADWNPHICNLLRRELAHSGYYVRSVHNAKELMQVLYRDNRISLLILDPDFPCLDTHELARQIARRSPRIPVVLHCVPGIDDLSMFDDGHVVHIEKNGSSVETLKVAIRRILKNRCCLGSDTHRRHAGLDPAP